MSLMVVGLLSNILTTKKLLMAKKNKITNYKIK